MQEIIIQFIKSYGVYAVFFLMISNGFASTPPSEAILGFAGVFVSYGHLDFYLTILAGVTGNIVGATLLYVIGLKIGYDWILKLKKKLKSTGKIGYKLSFWLPDREFIIYFQTLFMRKVGFIFVGIFRCFPVIRSIVSLPAGMAKMAALRFILYSFIGCFIWACFWVGLGFLLSESWQQWSMWITIVLLVFLGGLLFYIKSIVKRTFLGNSI